MNRRSRKPRSTPSTPARINSPRSSQNRKRESRDMYRGGDGRELPRSQNDQEGSGTDDCTPTPPVNTNAPDKADLELIRVEVVKSVTKRRQKLDESLKKGYATVYDQCLQEVRDKLKATKDYLSEESRKFVWGSMTITSQFSTWCSPSRRYFCTPNRKMRRWRNTRETSKACEIQSKHSEDRQEYRMS